MDFEIRFRGVQQIFYVLMEKQSSTDENKINYFLSFTTPSNKNTEAK